MFGINSLVLFLIDNLGIITLFVIVVSLVQHIYQVIKERRQLPPGPNGLPLLGYSPFLGPYPHKEIAKLGQKYGNVFT